MYIEQFVSCIIMPLSWYSNKIEYHYNLTDLLFNLKIKHIIRFLYKLSAPKELMQLEIKNKLKTNFKRVNLIKKKVHS